MSPKFFPDPVLSLTSNGIGKLNTLDVDNLSCIWTVFTKCAENLENGRRLENLSWRLWCRTLPLYRTPVLVESVFYHKSKSVKDKNLDVPELSVSVESASSSDEQEIKKEIENYDSSNVSILVQTSEKQNTVRHISPVLFQKIIMSLMPFKIEKKEKTDDTETSASHPYKKYVSEQLTNESSSDISDKSQLECSYETSLSSSDIRVSYTTKKKSLELKKQSPDSNKFVTKNSLEFCKNKTPHNDVQNHVKIQKSSKKSSKIFFIQETLPTESFIENIPKSSKSKSNLSKSPFHHHVKQEKRISFQKDIIPSHLPNNELFDYNGSSNSTDDNDWDSVYDSSISSSPNENPLFQKIDTCLSKPQIQSRRSLLSCMLQDKSGKVLANSSSKSSPAISLSQTSASPIIYKQVTYNQHPVTNVPSTSPHVISPQMVRRNMFASELSESLRKNLLWERQQKSATMFNTLKCRHNTHKGEGIDKLSTQAHKENYYFFDDTDYGYNAAGW